MSEASTGTDVYCPGASASSPERVRNEALAAVASHYGWARVAIVMIHRRWASDAARRSAGLRPAAAILGDACVKEAGTAAAACTASGGGPGIRFEGAPDRRPVPACSTRSWRPAPGSSTSPRARWTSARSTKHRETGKCAVPATGSCPRGSRTTFSWVATGGQRRRRRRRAGLLCGEVSTTGRSPKHLDARAAGLDATVCEGDMVDGRYCDGDGDRDAGWLARRSSTAYTLAKALDTIGRRPPGPQRSRPRSRTGDFEGFPGTVSLNDYEERDGPMTIVNLRRSRRAAFSSMSER